LPEIHVTMDFDVILAVTLQCWRQAVVIKILR